MMRKVFLALGAAAALGAFGYTTMAVTLVMQADTATVISFAASDRLPLLPQSIANWQVRSWKGCPVTDRDVSPLGQTLRGYGLEGFDNHRVLATASHLIDLGCDIDQRNMTGHTALHEAILYNEPDVVRFLLAHGADPAVTIAAAPRASGEMNRFFAGLDSLSFTRELQAKSKHAENREEILQLLEGHRPG